MLWLGFQFFEREAKRVQRECGLNKYELLYEVSAFILRSIVSFFSSVLNSNMHLLFQNTEKVLPC